MKFYEKYYNNNYDELITYYPRFYRDVFEMVEILKAHGRIMDGIEGNIGQTYFNGFIDYADEVTISKLEVFLGIGLDRNRTLEERRRIVKSYFVGSGKISASKIIQMIAVYTDSPVSCKLEPFDDGGNNRLYIEILNGEEETICTKDILAILSKRIPAHLLFCLASRWIVEIPVPVYSRSGLRMTGEFYPRYNVLPFLLDGKALLDGTYCLNGYLTGETLDFYPVMLRMIAGADWCTSATGTVGAQLLFRPEILLELKNDAALRIWGAACTKAQTKSRFYLQGNVNAGTQTSSQLTTQGELKEDISTSALPHAILGADATLSQEGALCMGATVGEGCVGEAGGTLTVEKDLWLLDGSVMLDGSRLLDAEIYKEEI